jgi:hypothetical protein
VESRLVQGAAPGRGIRAPTPAPAFTRSAEALAFEEYQRQEHLAWIERAGAETARQRKLAEVNGAWIPEDEGRGGLAEITPRDNEWINLDTRRRGRFS